MQQMARGLQAMENELKNLELQRQIFEQKLQDIQITKVTIENLEKMEDEQESIIPIGSEAFLRTQIEKPQTLIVNIGARYLIEQGVSECKDLHEKKEEQLKKALNIIDDRMNELIDQSEKIRPVLESMIQQMNLAQQAGAGIPKKINPADIG